MNQNGWIEEKLYNRIKQLIPIPCVDILATNEGSLLLLKRTNWPAKDRWFTPGGRVLLGERLEEASRRILHEETGLTPTRMQKIDVMCHFWPGYHTVTTYSHAEVDTREVVMNQEHSDYKWIKEPTKDLHPYLLEMIKESNIFK
jgi:ADP-ribose pyrophosphatase YjhB (NUDIX family)